METMQGRVKIGDRYVGDGEPCFIIAEAGVNHNGDVRLAERLTDSAAAAGADAIKFQSFHAGEIAIPSAGKAAYQRACGGDESQAGMLSRLEIPDDHLRDLSHYARDRGLVEDQRLCPLQRDPDVHLLLPGEE